MRKSDIIEEFLKIAQDRAIIPKSDVPKANDTTREMISDFTARTDAEERERIKQIAKLYDVKTDMLDDMDYDFNIVEVAHPEPVVVSDSYDKLNGLVENINERSSIMQMIVNKMPDGRINNPKYAAQKDLMLSLIRVANELDYANKDELRVLADVCVEQSAKEINKTAAIPLLIVAPIVGAIIGLYAKQHLPFYSDGFEVDHQKLVKELDDILSANSNFGVGKDYKRDFIQSVSLIKKDIVDFHGIMNTVLPMLNELDKPKDGKELIQMSQHSNAAEIEKAVKGLEAGATNLFTKLITVRDNFKDTDYKNRQIKEKGVVDNLMEKAFMLGGKGLIADDMDDVSHALDTYMNDINKIIQTLKEASAMGQSAQTKLEEANVQRQEQAQATPKPTAHVAQTTEEIDDFGAGELSKQFGFE